MNIKFHSSVIFCSDLEKQREFYEKFLGQQVEQDLGRCLVLAGGLTLWETDKDYPIAKELGYTYEPIGNRNLEICFETENFADAVENVLMGDLRLLHNVVEESWGQYTIRFYDPEGNLVEIGESLKCMALRLRTSGMDNTQVAAKTGLDKGYVEHLLSQQGECE